MQTKKRTFDFLPYARDGLAMNLTGKPAAAPCRGVNPDMVSIAERRNARVWLAAVSTHRRFASPLVGPLDQMLTPKSVKFAISSPKTLVHGVSDHFARPRDMLAHEIAGAPGVAALECREDQRMFLHRFAPARLRKNCLVAGATDAGD